MLESELFGHERGAFTGAETLRIGRFEQADHGTIFLDEIGDMTPGTQIKLLRVLQEKCLQRLGGKPTIAVDVRVLAATHRDLEQAIKAKQFREDLYYRLNVFPIRLPPLRERREDLPLLVDHFTHLAAAQLGCRRPDVTGEAMTLLGSYRWTADNRILWAGRLAPYFWANDMSEGHMRNPPVHAELKAAFERFFPVWKDVRFTHAYGGAVAITASFVPCFGRLDGGVVYGYGYNGHGVAPSHTGGKVLRDLVMERDSEYTNLLFVNGRERGFPPEPLRLVGARLTERLLERQDRRFDRGEGSGEMDPLLLRLLR